MHILDFLLCCGVLAACSLIGFVVLQLLFGGLYVISVLLYGALSTAWKWITNRKNS